MSTTELAPNSVHVYKAFVSRGLERLVPRSAVSEDGVGLSFEERLLDFRGQVVLGTRGKAAFEVGLKMDARYGKMMKGLLETAPTASFLCRAASDVLQVPSNAPFLCS